MAQNERWVEPYSLMNGCVLLCSASKLRAVALRYDYDRDDGQAELVRLANMGALQEHEAMRRRERQLRRKR